MTSRDDVCSSYSSYDKIVDDVNRKICHCLEMLGAKGIEEYRFTKSDNGVLVYSKEEE